MTAYFDCGFSVRQPAWHGLADILDDYPESWDEARMAAGLMWEPAEAKLYIPGPDGSFVPVEGFKAITRDDTGAVLAPATEGFSLISHALMGEMIEAILGDKNVLFETAGSLREGRSVWALVRLDEPYTVPGDDSPIYPYLALLNHHDGTGAAKATFTDVRVICWNTWQAAEAQGERDGSSFSFRHVGNPAERIAEAKDALAALRDNSRKQADLFRQLALVPVNDQQVMTFTEAFLPSPRDHGEFCSDRVQANVDHARGVFTQLHNESLTTDAVRGTAYGLLQASTEYLDHVRRFNSRDSYVGRTVLRPEPLKAKALALIGEVTGS
jgi:phage/plasmid-like protein (TIGR03299 family)